MLGNSEKPLQSPSGGVCLIQMERPASPFPSSCLRQIYEIHRYLSCPNFTRGEAGPIPLPSYSLKILKKPSRASKKKFEENLLTLALFLKKFV